MPLMRSAISDATGDEGASYPPHPPPHTACAANAQINAGTPRAAPSTAATSCAAAGPLEPPGVCSADPNDATDEAVMIAARLRGVSAANVMNTPARTIPTVRYMVPPKVGQSRRSRARRCAILLKIQHFW
jgi:hypothetical protein